MISFEFVLGDKTIKASTDSRDEAMSVLTAVSKVTDPRLDQLVRARAAKAAKNGGKITHPARKSSYVRKTTNSPRAWAKWTMEEVRALNENKGLKVRDILRIPVLSGRNPKTISAMRGCLRNHIFSYAPSNFRKMAQVVLAEGRQA